MKSKIDLDYAYSQMKLSKETKEKVKEIIDLKHTENQKQLQSFLGAIKIFSKIFTKTIRKNGKITKEKI